MIKSIYVPVASQTHTDAAMPIQWAEGRILRDAHLEALAYLDVQITNGWSVFGQMDFESAEHIHYKVFFIIKSEYKIELDDIPGDKVQQDGK